MSNRRISEFPALNGADIDEQDLLTLVHVFEVDPTLRNKKITFTEFRSYLDQYYAALDGVSLLGNVTITGDLTVGNTLSGNVIQSTGLTSLNNLTVSGTSNFSGIVVQYNATVTGTVNAGLLQSPTVSGATVTGNTFKGTTFTGVSGVFTAQFSGETITGNTLKATSVTGVSGVFTSNLSGATITGDTIQATTGTFGTLVTSDYTVQNNLTVSGDLSVLGSGSFASGVVVSGTLSGTTLTGTTINTTSGVFVNLSGATVTGDVGEYSTITGISGVFTSQVSGATVTGNTGLFTDITGSTLHITTPSGATAALVCSGVVSGDANGFVIQGPLVILP